MLEEVELRTFNSTNKEDVLEAKSSSHVFVETNIKRRRSVATRTSPRNLAELRRSMKRHGTQAFLQPRHDSEVGWDELMNDFVGSKIEIQKGEEKRQAWVLYPDTWKFKIWNVIVFVSLVYTTVVAPIQAALWNDLTMTDPSNWPFVFTADRLVDIVFSTLLFILHTTVHT
jgi:hypothetical protein